MKYLKYVVALGLVGAMSAFSIYSGSKLDKMCEEGQARVELGGVINITYDWNKDGLPDEKIRHLIGGPGFVPGRVSFPVQPTKEDTLYFQRFSEGELEDS
jgi:hypothetical protein